MTVFFSGTLPTRIPTAAGCGFDFIRQSIRRIASRFSPRGLPVRVRKRAAAPEGVLPVAPHKPLRFRQPERLQSISKTDRHQARDERADDIERSSALIQAGPGRCQIKPYELFVKSVDPGHQFHPIPRCMPANPIEPERPFADCKKIGPAKVAALRIKVAMVAR